MFRSLDLKKKIKEFHINIIESMRVCVELGYQAHKEGKTLEQAYSKIPKPPNFPKL